MQIYKIDPLTDERWTKFVNNCSHASIFHSEQWLRAIHRTYGYKPVVFTTSPLTGELKNGILFCHVGSWLTGTRMVSVPFSDHCEPLVDTAAELEFLLNCLRTDMEHRDWSYIEIRPVNGRFENTSQKAGFVPASFYYIHRIDLRPPLEQIFASLNKDSVQRRIRRAQKAGVTRTCGRSEALLKDFYGLMVLTRKRLGIPPQPYSWFSNLMNCMDDALEIRVAYWSGRPIAAVLTVRFRNTVCYKYACSDAQYHKLAAMPALLWDIIKNSKDAGMEEVELGRSSSSDKGLINFKTHWTKKFSQLVYWRYPKPRHITSDDSWTMKVMKPVFGYMPKRMLPIAGRLLYRHIG